MREDWTETYLPNVCDILDNLRKPINSNERKKRIEGKPESELYPYYGATGQVGYIDDYLTDGEFVLIGEDGAPFLDYTRNVAYKINGKTWVNNHAHILKSFFNNDYLLHYLNQFHFRDFVTGTTRLKLTQGALKRMPVKLAPLPEQRAIVHKIENLFASLDKGIADLKKAQEQLKVYRQAVLKKAFEGELTKEWREKNVKISGHPSREKNTISIAAEPEKEYKNKGTAKLPEGWKWVKLEDVGIWKGGGTPSKRKKEFWDNGDVLWVSPKDMKTKVITDTINRITEKSIENSSAKWIEKGAILIVVRSGIIRRTLPVAIAGKRLTVNQDMQTIHPCNDFVSAFVYWFLMAFERDIRQNCAKDGTTVDNINVPVFKKYNIGKPSLEEQHQIAQEIESRLSVCDKVEQNITEGLEKSEALRQSILKKAFEGKLLSQAEIEKCKQEADYEPASVLLEKIKKSRRDETIIAKKKKTKPKTPKG
ncbi:MAG: restriction endonuclease subunit S [Bacteroidota bacterium]